MDKARRKLIEARWREIDEELAAMYENRITLNGDPAAREAELLDEQDALEYELGEDFFNEEPGRE